jgi:hypothetical protein
MQKKVESIIKEVAAETSLPEYVVKAIVECQFQCAREAMKKGESGNPSTFLNVRLRHLGLLVAKPGKINKLHAIKVAKTNDNEK